MKKLYRNCFIYFLVCLISINLQAKEVNKQTAEKVAVNAFAGLDNNKNISGFQVKEILTVKSGEEISFYIVNFKPTGFIILSVSDACSNTWQFNRIELLVRKSPTSIELFVE